MQPGFRLLFVPVLVSALLSSCGEPPPPPISRYDIGPGVGPFDANGNYREDWADDPTKWRRPTTLASNDRPPANANPLPNRPYVANTPPKPYVAPKPSVTRHTVKRGDTLSAIAKRYGCSVAALRSANRISGSLIHPGQRLVIPRR